MKVNYESNGKKIEDKLDGQVVQGQFREVGPDLFRFKTINALKKVNVMYKKDIDEAR
jgi:hypothetical protein